MDVVKIRNIMIENCLLNLEKPVLVGVSGGPDSLCLLNLFYQLGYPVIAAHFNHQLRPGSEHESRQVHAMADACNARFICDSHDVRRLAEQNRQSIEEAARQARYLWLFSRAEDLNAQAVAVAHNADDQVETVLMHLLRGAGLSGLRGMDFRSAKHDWKSSIPLVRPLLSTWRYEIDQYCEQHHLAPIQDPTNQETNFFRNRLRHELIPYLKQYNPRVDEVLWRMAQTLTSDHEALMQFFIPVWETCCMVQDKDYLKFSLVALQSLPDSLQRMVIRQAVARLHPGLRDFDFAAVERARQFIAKPVKTNQLDIAANFRLFLEGDNLFIAKWGFRVIDPEWPQLQPGQSYTLNVPGFVNLENGYTLETIVEEVGEMPPPDHITPETAYLDAGRLDYPLVVRTRRPGDRFTPLGMGGHSMKLSNFFINQHLPVRARDGWPLVCSGDTIIWVAGMRLSHSCQVNRDTQSTLRLSLQKTTR